MAYLEEGHSFDEVVNKLAENHPKIKNIRIFARNAIRETTGEGIFDDYIHEHKLWQLRNPVFAPPDVYEALKKMWEEMAANGRRLIEMDARVKEALSKDDDTAKLLEHAMLRSRSPSRK